MPAVISTVITAEGYTQVDGRRYVTEDYVLDDGTTESYTYLAAVGTKYSTVSVARVLAIESRPVEVPDEFLKKVDSLRVAYLNKEDISDDLQSLKLSASAEIKAEALVDG